MDSLLISFAHLDEHGELVTDVGAATVFGNASKQGLELQRGAEESESQFLARVDAERVRIHGLSVLKHDCPPSNYRLSDEAQAASAVPLSGNFTKDLNDG